MLAWLLGCLDRFNFHVAISFSLFLQILPKGCFRKPEEGNCRYSYVSNDDFVDGSEEEELEKDFTTTAEKNTEFSDGDGDADADADADACLLIL